MEKRTGVVTFAGGPITLVGPEVKVGQQAPDFTVLSNDLQPKTLKDFEGKVKVISVVPSLDTGVCVVLLALIKLLLYPTTKMLPSVKTMVS